MRVYRQTAAGAAATRRAQAYYVDTEAGRTSAQAGWRRHSDNGRARLAKIKLATGCMDCGYADDAAKLHFHHRDKTTKSFSVGLGARLAWERQEAEIVKCDVLCAPCHAKRHAEEN